jgi:hypothetical protein
MPFEACNCQTLLATPGVNGATILIEMLMTFPGAAAGIGCGDAAPRD